MTSLSANLEIRPAAACDMEAMMELCRMIYPGGDYVEDTWHAWLADGGLRILWMDGMPAGMFNVSVHRKQGWVEGTRVHPDFRRRGIGTAVLRYSERFVADMGGRIVRSLIEKSNAASLARSAKAGWHRGPLWGWYRTGSSGRGKPQAQDVAVAPDGMAAFLGSTGRNIDGVTYLDSWRVYDLAGSGRDVMFLSGPQGWSASIVINARHFQNTATVTVLDGTDLSGLAAYLRGTVPKPERMHGWDSGLHIASEIDGTLLEDAGFERISSYYLMSSAV